MEEGDQARRPVLAANVDVIDTSERRSSPFASPSGTLRTVAEGVRVVSPAHEVPQAHPEGPIPSPRRRGTPTSSRRSSSHRVSYDDLVSRPRSNPRSRTPMRYESPLEHGAFRRDRNHDNENNEEEFQPRAITIRPGAGLGIGVSRAMPERANFDDTAQRPRPITLQKSRKQGPSQRKTRRWNNDNFVNSFHDLASSSSSKSRAAAQILAAAKADARHFLPAYDPADTQRSEQVTKFMKDAKYSEARDQFFQGELHAPVPTRPSHKPQPENWETPEQLFLRVEGRLRRVVVKACENSAPACMVVGYFEEYLIRVFEAEGDGPCEEIECEFWKDLLMEKPTITYKNWNNQPTRNVTLLFDGDSSTGGFHRLLVSAVAHFHCLKATTSTLDDNSRKARVLSVHGVIRGAKHRLLDHLEALQKAKQRQ